MRLLFRVIDFIKAVISAVRKRIDDFDKRMRKHYKPELMAALTIAVIAVLISIQLFLPPYLGISNDGSADNVLADVGLQRIDPEDGTAYFSYYERTYYIEKVASAPGTTGRVQQLLIRFAILLDTLFTQDTVFDVRFLAAVYLVLYLAALWPFLRMLLRRVSIFSEAILLSVFAVFIFAETTIAVILASFYTQPLELILLLTVTDGALYAGQRHGNGFGPLVMTAATVALMTVNAYCCLVGIVVAVALWIIAVGNPNPDKTIERFNRAACIVMALLLTAGSVFATIHMEQTRTREQRYDQMTRGVLFQAQDPEEALSFFGIEARYTVLTETYADQEFPIVIVNDGVLDEGFLDHYSTGNVLLYYCMHPTAVVGLFDVGVRNAFVTRSDYSGNYERSVGLPPMAKALFISVWSTFKEQSAPKTVGTLIALAFLLAILHRKKKRDEVANKERSERLTGFILFDMVFLSACIELLTVVLMTGDAELIRESSLMGYMIDILVMYFLTEVLHKTRIAVE